MMRRGVTLIEVLAATILLAVIIAATAPILRRTVGVSENLHPSIDVAALARIVAAEEGAPADLLVRRHPSADPEAAHEWVSYTVDGVTIVRFEPLPEVEEVDP